MANDQNLKNLLVQLAYIADRSPFYRRRFDLNGIDASQIKSYEAFSKIPFTTKEDLQNWNADFLCVPPQKLIDHVATSGTTGKAVNLSLTDKDLDRLADNEYRSFLRAGITENDTIQLMTTIDRRFMAGMAYFLGARKLGAGILRVGNGLPELQWENILSMRPGVIICVPSFIPRLIQYAEDKNIDYKNSPVRKAICIGEAVRNPDLSLNNLGKRILEKWPLQLFSTYASSEMATAFTECEHGMGGHQEDELIFTELVDEAGDPVEDGQPGELVVTPLGVEGMPLLRFRTGDICMAIQGTCACGKTGRRLSPLLGRKNQMIKYKGTTLYPNAIHDILAGIRELENYQVVLETGSLDTDEICIYMGINDKSKVSVSEISDIFRSKLRVVPAFHLLKPEKVQEKLFPGENRKPLLLIDKRSTTKYDAGDKGNK